MLVLVRDAYLEMEVKYMDYAGPSGKDGRGTGVVVSCSRRTRTTAIADDDDNGWGCIRC